MITFNCDICDTTVRKRQQPKENLCAICKRRSKRKDVKHQSLDYKGNKCLICAYDKCKRALVFHHINPDEKDFKIGSGRVTWEDVKTELDKCVLLCANCHAEIHENIKSLEDYLPGSCNYSS